MPKRKYQLKKRAAKQEQTRARIVEATVALHQELGPKATTISAVAERAGVQRLTVYRHFPTERDLLAACSSSFVASHPPPDLGAIATHDPADRTRAVLSALYGYYGTTADMWASVYRDKDQVEAVAEALRGFEGYLEAVHSDLLAAWAPRRSKRLRASLGHALRFSTWQSLARQGLAERDIAELVSTWIEAAAG
jgi:AcrR family transcriptional regulator